MLIALDTLSEMPRKTLPESVKKVPIGARLDPALLSELEAIAKADERTISFMVEKAVRLLVESVRGKSTQKKR